MGNKSVILHETDIRQAKYGTPYHIMNDKTKREMFWGYMGELFDKHDIVVTSVISEPALCNKIYNTPYLNDEYYICLQIILGNFTYYLEQNDSRGYIYIESRKTGNDDTLDRKLRTHYFNLMASGTLFLQAECLQNRIFGEENVNKTFKIPMKLVHRMNKICDMKNVSLNKLVVKCIEYALDNSDIEINENIK